MSYGNNNDSGWRPSQQPPKRKSGGGTWGTPKSKSKPGNSGLSGGYGGKDSGWRPGSGKGSSKAAGGAALGASGGKNKTRNRNPDSYIGQHYGSEGYGGNARVPGGGRSKKSTSGPSHLVKPNANKRSVVSVKNKGNRHISGKEWAESDVDKSNTKKYKNLKTAAERRAFRIQHGYHRGAYYGPDIFKGDLKKVEAWEKAGRPKVGKLIAKGNAMRSKYSSKFSTDNVDRAFNPTKRKDYKRPTGTGVLKKFD